MDLFVKRLRWKNPHRTLLKHKKAIEFAQEAGDYHGAAIDMLNLGDAYTDLKNFSEAQYYLQKGLLMVQKLGDKY